MLDNWESTVHKITECFEKNSTLNQYSWEIKQLPHNLCGIWRRAAPILFVASKTNQILNPSSVKKERTLFPEGIRGFLNTCQRLLATQGYSAHLLLTFPYAWNKLLCSSLTPTSNSSLISQVFAWQKYKQMHYNQIQQAGLWKRGPLREGAEVMTEG